MQELKEMLLSRGAALVGFADVRPLAPDARDGLPAGVSFAVPLDPAIVAGIADGPTLEYRDEYVRVNALIDEMAPEAAELLRLRGWRASARAATVEEIDPELRPIALPHKTVATLAGLGWVGKCALLVTERFGSAVRLGTVLTDAPLPPAGPTTESRCGDCAACVEICPGRAPTGRQWRPGLTRADIFSAHACREALRDSARRLGHGICGMCIAACPWTRRYLGAERDS
jgi:epoxyqueuosine reductase QueG